MKRGAGILMPIFSLPNKERFGVLGQSAYDFVDFLVKSGQTYWQVLPVNETDIYGSPFCSTCINSGNPLYIDLSGILSKEELKVLEDSKLTPNEYKKIKLELLYKAYKKDYSQDKVEEFIKSNEWVIAYSEFSAILEEYKFLSSYIPEL